MNGLTGERMNEHKKDEPKPVWWNYSEIPDGCYIMVMHRLGSNPLCCGSLWER